MPHYDALVLTLCISGFDVHRVPIDPSSGKLIATTRLQTDKAFHKYAELSRASALGFQRSDHHDTRGRRALCKGQASHSTSLVLNFRRLRAVQCHSRPNLAALDEGYPLNIPPDGQLFEQFG